MAGGQLPPAPLMAALTALTALGVVLVTKWEMTAFSLAAVLAVAQAVLHEAFSTLSGATTPPSNAPALHVHETVVRAPTASAGPGFTQPVQVMARFGAYVVRDALKTVQASLDREPRRPQPG